MKSFSCSCLVGCPFVSDGDLDLRRDLDQDGVDALWDCDDQDPEVGERKSVYMDEDGDGYGSNKETTNCDPDVTFAWNDNDCDDGDPEIHPRAEETCDQTDNDCDGDIDEEVVPTWFPDRDDDGYGGGLDARRQCHTPEHGGWDWITTGGDCDDYNPAINPDADPICNDVDNDCLDGVDCDDDGDGHSDFREGEGGTDCNDEDPDVWEASFDWVDEHGLDDNCDGIPDEHLLSDADAHVIGMHPDSSAGTSASISGDLDGDGYDDLVLGARYADTDDYVRCGAAHVVFGPIEGDVQLDILDASGILGPRVVTVGTSEDCDDDGLPDLFGTFVTILPDMTMDGINELVILAPGENSGEGDEENVGGGVAHLFLGPIVDGLSTEDASTTWWGHSAGSRISYLAHGDINNDSFGDLLIGGNMLSDDSTEPDPGIIYVITGPIDTSSGMGLEEAALVIEGAESNDRLGTANRQCVVDFNGDNDADLMVTSRSARSATGEPVGGVYFCDDPFQHLGRCGGEAGPRCSIDQLGVQILGDEPHQQFASGISKAGDVDGDGYEDVLVRAQTASHQGENSGSIYVLYGNANVREGAVAPAGPAPTTRIDGREAEHYFGQTATGIGDPDGDRIHDILIGARGPDGEEEAASYLFCGPIEQGVYGMLPDEALAVIPEVGDGTYPDSGSFPAVGGDLNGDSVDDFVLPVPNEDSERGGAYVFFGSSP